MYRVNEDWTAHLFSRGNVKEIVLVSLIAVFSEWLRKNGVSSSPRPRIHAIGLCK